MKVYCVWAWDNYYPYGENGNLKGVYSTFEAAQKRENYIRYHCSFDHVSITTENVSHLE